MFLIEIYSLTIQTSEVAGSHSGYLNFISHQTISVEIRLCSTLFVFRASQISTLKVLWLSLEGPLTLRVINLPDKQIKEYN